MTRLFLDASAIVALLAREPEAVSFDERLAQSGELLTSPVAIWEASRGLANVRAIDLAEARGAVDDFLEAFEVRCLAIGPAEGRLALDAHERFGKGRHRAALNMGDCFAYACTKRHADEILFKGEDFIHTDLRDAMLP